MKTTKTPCALISLNLWFFVATLMAAPRMPVPPWPEQTFGIWGFDESLWFASFEPKILGMEAAQTVDSWSGYALLRDLTSASGPVAIPAVDGAKTNVACERGAIRFWFCPQWSSTGAGGKGPGYHARLLELVGFGTKSPQTRWALYLNPEGTGLYFSGRDNNGGVSDFLNAPVTFQAGQWRMITVCYSPTNSALFLDGALVATGTGVAAPARWEFASQGLVVGSDLAGGNTAQGEFDELRTFDYWPDESQESFYYRGVSRQAAMGPIGTAEEEAVKQQTLAAQDQTDGSTPLGGGPLGPLDGGYPSNTLYLEITSVGEDSANVTLHNTTEGSIYELLSKESLTSTQWISEGTVFGVEGQDWTPTTIPVLTRTNTLFIEARNLTLDSDGQGLPDWWQQEYFGHWGVDPYADPDGDGWSNIQEYFNTSNPIVVDPPPIVGGLNVAQNGSGYNVISWNPTAVAPNTFTIQRNTGSGWQTIGTINGTMNSFTDTALPPGTSASYQVSANYPGASSAFATYNPSGIDPGLTWPATVASGAGGRLFLLTSRPSTGVTGLVVTASAYDSYHPKDGISAINPLYPFTPFHGINNDVSGILTTNIATGLPLTLATNFVPRYGYYQFFLSPLGANGKSGSVVQPTWYANATPFLDGRQDMLDNLNFLLRAGTALRPFDFYFASAAYNQTEGADYGILPSYTTAGYNGKNAAGRLITLDAFDEFQPFEDGSILRAFCYTSNRFDSLGNPLDAGFDGTPTRLPTMNTWNYYFSSLAYAQSGNTNTPPRQLDSTNAQYIFFGPVNDGQNIPDLGLTWNSNTHAWSIGSARNVYGLPILSVRAVRATQTAKPVVVYTAQPGGTIPSLSDGGLPGTGWLYFQADTPRFQNIGWHVTAGLFSNRNGPGLPSWDGIDRIAVPILNVGEQIHMAAWAKLAVTNGYSGTTAYLQQYFDKAYKMDASGAVTTNQTGILSEYGDFLATEPGAVGLVTKPDPATGLSYTSVVQVISVNVDANHDGIMDLTFSGADYVTSGKPYRFWVNNDRDEPATSTKPDRDLESLPNRPETQDWSHGHIRCKRNLEDFARLWVSGLPALPGAQGYSIKLSMSSFSGDPALNLYASYDTNGSPSYLTNRDAAGAQFTQQYLNGQLIFDYAQKLKTIDAGQSYTLPVSVTTGQPLFTRFLFEGAGKGSGQLVLTIYQGSNVVAQTSVWIDLRDIKELYEQAVVTNVRQEWPEMVEEEGVSGFQKIIHSPDEDLNATEQVAVFVHGWRVPLSEYFIFA